MGKGPIPKLQDTKSQDKGRFLNANDRLACPGRCCFVAEDWELVPWVLGLGLLRFEQQTLTVAALLDQNLRLPTYAFTGVSSGATALLWI